MCLHKRLGGNSEKWVNGQRLSVSFTWVLHRLGDFICLKIGVLVMLVMVEGFFSVGVHMVEVGSCLSGGCLCHEGRRLARKTRGEKGYKYHAGVLVKLRLGKRLPGY